LACDPHHNFRTSLDLHRRGGFVVQADTQLNRIMEQKDIVCFCSHCLERRRQIERAKELNKGKKAAKLSLTF